MRQSDKFAIFKLIPPKLALTLIAVAIVYAIGQPFANARFGWSLPSIADIAELDLSGDNAGKSNEAVEKPQREKTPEPTKKLADAQKKNATQESDKNRSSESTTSAKKSQPTNSSETQAESRPSDLHDGFLREVGRNRYESPAGLIYGPGSEEGHRLKHIERHLVDQPNRPGSHGVFEGDMKEMLAAIDDAFTRASKGAKGTSRRDEDGMMVYEATFDKPIGYIGGSTGKRKQNPDSKRLRVVVSGKNVITAFPF